MPYAHALKSTQDRGLLLPFLSAFLIVMVLFFIDEGYYDFRWMKDGGNWVVFGFYMAFFFTLQMLIYHFLLRRFQLRHKALLMLLVVMPVTLALFFLVVS